MALDEEFEQNIRLVVEQLRKCKEEIGQLYVIKDGRITGLPDAGIKAYQALAFHLTVSSPPERQLQRILKWLVRDLPNVKVELENQYYNIVRNSIRIAQVSDEPKLSELLRTLESNIGKLDEDLCYYAEMAREDLGPDKPNEPNDLITLAVVIQDYEISRAQLKRDIANGTPRSYRKKPRGKHKVSRKEVGNLYTKS